MSTRPDGKYPVQVLLDDDEYSLFEQIVIQRLKGKRTGKGKGQRPGFGPVIKEFALKQARSARHQQQPQEA